MPAGARARRRHVQKLSARVVQVRRGHRPLPAVRSQHIQQRRACRRPAPRHGQRWRRHCAHGHGSRVWKYRVGEQSRPSPFPCAACSQGSHAYTARAQGLAFWHDSGTLFVADRDRHQIKKLSVSDTGSQTGNVSVVCGQENTAGSADGVASDATFNEPGELAVTRDGAWLIVADTGNHLMRRIRVSSQGSVPLYSTFSLGSPGASGHADGSSPDCRFKAPSGMIEGMHGRGACCCAALTARRRTGPVARELASACIACIALCLKTLVLTQTCI